MRDQSREAPAGPLPGNAGGQHHSSGPAPLKTQSQKPPFTRTRGQGPWVSRGALCRAGGPAGGDAGGGGAWKAASRAPVPPHTWAIRKGQEGRHLQRGRPARACPLDVAQSHHPPQNLVLEAGGPVPGKAEANEKGLAGASGDIKVPGSTPQPGPPLGLVRIQRALQDGLRSQRDVRDTGALPCGTTTS